MTLKTHETDDSVVDFIHSIKEESVREDCLQLDKLFRKITGEGGRMWGKSIVGYGKYSYTRSDKKLYEYLAVGFSPRVGKLTIYNIPGYESHPDLMAKLGNYSIGKSCLYVKRLSDIDLKVLEQILHDGYQSIVGKHLDYKTGVWSETN